MGNQLSLFSEADVPFVNEVEIFNVAFGKEQQNRTTPTINEKDADFVIKFIEEELDELKEAVEKRDIIEILDALMDITYVGLGNGALAFGLKDKILPAYAEVQASNLSKLCNTEELAKNTVIQRSVEQGEECHYKPIGDNFVVYRTRDLKVMKSLFYKRPNLKQFFTEDEINSCKK